MSPPPLRIAVIGGGISGLAAAHRLTQLAASATVRLFEAGPRLGGALNTRHDGDLVLEQGADSFLTRDPVAIDLCRELDLGDELLPTSELHRRALVVCRGRLVPVPAGFVLMQPRQLQPMLRSGVLSLRGKLRLLAEPLIRKPPGVSSADDDESVASFSTRRLGREAYERLVEPLLAGIYVADAEQLSLAATFPEFLIGEREHGSLRRAWLARIKTMAAPASGASPLPSPPRRGEGTGGNNPGDASGARYGEFMTLRGGVGRLVATLASRLPQGCVQLSQPVSRVARAAGGMWHVTIGSGGAEEFAGVIVSTPAARAAAMVAEMDAELASLLTRITAASSVVVTLVYRRDQIARPVDGFGFVVPRIENRPIIAASFPSVKFADRGPADLAPVRVFMGGSLRPELVDRDDAELIAIARRELAELIGARGEPRETMVARWRDAMPQYHVGHLNLVAEIERRTANHPGLEFAGNSYRGVGIPQCIRSGREAAERIVTSVTRPG